MPGLEWFGDPGTNGGNGGSVDYWIRNQITDPPTETKQRNNAFAGGTGQGHNTRKYGNSSGTVYSTVNTAVSANTGNSGKDGLGSYTTRNGSSGVVIVMCHFQ